MGTRLRGAVSAASVVLAALLSSELASSQPGELTTARNTRLAPLRTEECGKACQEKVRHLETQVRSLQREVVQLRAEVDRLRALDVGEPVAEREPESTRCDPPYTVDRKGIRRYRPECLEHASLSLKELDCDSLYFERADGVKVFKPECMR